LTLGPGLLGHEYIHEVSDLTSRRPKREIA
jgi:hypothetical protein